MKKSLTALLLVALAGHGTYAMSGIWATPFGGYRTSGSLKLDDPNYSKVDLSDNPVYGFALGKEVPEGLLEVMWTHQDANATVVPVVGGPAAQQFDLNVDQFHFNGLYLPQGYDRFQPYAMAGLGVTRYVPTGNFDSLSRFSWAVGGGMLVELTSHLALRFEGKWNPALINSSSAVFCNTGTGTCVVTASGDLIEQFDFTAGLTLRL